MYIDTARGIMAMAVIFNIPQPLDLDLESERGHFRSLAFLG